MKSKKRAVVPFFVVLALIIALTFTAFFGAENWYGDKQTVYFKGANDIRWGIDIRGGVEAVYKPVADKDVKITGDDIEAAKSVLEARLVNKNIADYEIYADKANHQVILRFPWAANEADFDAVQTVKNLGASSMVVFRKGGQNDQDGEVVLKGSADVKKAETAVDPETGEYVISLEFTSSGRTKFANATKAMVGKDISIWLDTTTTDLDKDGKPVVEKTWLQTATVREVIDQGKCTISGSGMTAEYVNDICDKINGGKLPFSITADESKIQVISPTLGNNALEVMVIAGSIAFALVCLLMVLRYRLNGFVASLALLGQLAGSIACISGYFADVESFTLTIPGIAGIILSIGVGVDCNVIAAERIRDEFQKGKTIDGAIDSGYKNSLSAIIDGNVTIVIVSLVLMGAFGTPDSLIAKVFSPIMSLFGTSITGSIYSFGYTLLVGTIFNLIMGVLASRIMIKSISKIKFLRNPALYGGKKNA